MTNTKSRSRRFDAPAAEAFTGSPFTHPMQVKEALELARRDELEISWPARLATTRDELWSAGLIEVYQTRRGGQGAWAFRVRLTSEGKARLSRASRASLLAVNGLL